MNDGTGMANVHASTHCKRPTSPSRVHQPAGNLMPFNFLPQQTGINRRLKDHKGGAKAGAESSGWLASQSLFGSSDFSRVTGEEVVHGLCRSEPGDGRHHSKSIAGKHDDVSGMAGH